MTQEITQRCYTLQAAPWLDNAGFEKGRQQDRQPLGFILPANTSLRVRQADMTKGKATFRLLCDDSQVEKTITLSASWQTISATVDTVPFVDTLYTDQPGEFTVLYELPQTIKPLPYWSKGQSESDFFSHWRQNASPFALVDADVVCFLLPLADRDNLQKTGLATLQAFYTDIFGAYNEWAGLSDNPASALNKNVPNSYFIKADKHGVGSAYYLPWWCAQTSSTVSQGWIDNITTQWTILHEIAHGYQGKFMKDTEIPVGEVWNNIYAAYFQQATLSVNNRLYTDGWLYNFGQQPAEELKFITNVRSHLPVAQWGGRTRLLMLMMMLFRANTPAFSAFNQQYRELANSEGFLATEHHLTDLLASAIASETGYDMTPFMIFCGLKPDAFTFEKVAAAKPVWPLFDLLAESEWESARQRLNLDSFVWLVDNQQLAILGKKGKLALTLNIDRPEQVYGQSLTLRDNGGQSFTATIVDKQIAFSDLPVGVYQLDLPQGRSQKYRVDATFVTVREGTNAVTVNYTPLADTALRNQTLHFQGYDNTPFASLCVDYENQTLTLDIFSATPHLYFSSQRYASVTVFSDSGEQLLKRDMSGTNCATGKIQLPLKENYHLSVYHAEPGRLKAAPGYLTLVAPQPNQLLRIDREGLYNFVLNNRPVDDLRTVFVHHAQALRDLPSWQNKRYSARKNDLWLMLQNVPDAERQSLLKEYNDVLPADNSVPGALTGKSVTLKLQGLKNNEFCQIAIDNAKREIVVQTRAGQPHAYYLPGATYASIDVRNAAGEALYHRQYQGAENYQAQTERIALEEGCAIDIFHDEPFRVSAYNLTQNTLVPVKRTNLWYVTPFGLEEQQTALPAQEDRKDETALYGDRFVWDLLGDNDACFASMALDIGGKQFTFSAHAGVPHSAFSTVYATVNVYNTRGSVVARQAIKGTSELGDYVDTAALEENYIIEVFHAEAGRRSLIANPRNGETWPQPHSVSWRVTARGLERL